MTLAPPHSRGVGVSREMSNELSAETSYVLVDDPSNAGADLMLVTNEDDMPTTERLLEELSNGTLGNS